MVAYRTEIGWFPAILGGVGESEFWPIIVYNRVMFSLHKLIWARSGGRDGFDA
jgi:hypothetical protein